MPELPESRAGSLTHTSGSQAEKTPKTEGGKLALLGDLTLSPRGLPTRSLKHIKLMVARPLPRQAKAMKARLLKEEEKEQQL